MAEKKDLSALLKSNFVELQVRLDVDGSLSALKGQVDDITKKLKGKYVELDVRLNYNIKDLNKQINTLNRIIRKRGEMFSPIKLKVDIDIDGSADKIKNRMKEIQGTMSDFNKTYKKQLKEISDLEAKASKSSKKTTKDSSSTASNGNIKDTDNVQYFDNIKKYKKALGEAERLLRSKSAKGEGLFSSLEIKDAKGNLETFIGTLERADGIIDKVKYKFDHEKGAFQLVDRQVLTQTEKEVHKAMQSLQDLQSQIFKTGDKANSFIQESQALWDKGINGNLTQKEVKNLQRRVKEEQTLQQVMKKENAELLSQKKLIQDINKARDERWSKSGKVEDRTSYNDLAKKVSAGDSDLGEAKLELARINTEIDKRIKKEKESMDNTKKRLKVLQDIRKLEHKTVSTDKTSQNLIKEIKLMTERAKSAKEWMDITQKFNKLEISNDNNNRVQKTKDIDFKLRQQMGTLVELGQMTEAQFNEAIKRIPITAASSFADLERQLSDITQKVKETQARMKREANNTVDLIGGTNDKKVTSSQIETRKGIRDAIDNNDINSLQKYIGEIYRGQVETVKMQQQTDGLGRAVDRLQVKMKGTGKTVQTYTIDMDRANETLRQVSQGTDYNANRNLGVFEQLKIAMARVPVWMASMTAFYGSIRSVQAMVSEVMAVDKAMTELNRVAGSNTNIDAIFQSSVQTSKELGNNIHDILQTMNDFARTYGNFSDRQLMDITETAVLMSNVSELSATEAGSALVSTMNAFNISASDSIRIVDALNEVDNEYAVSTKQLAEGLSKSASTAKTFGVSLEENVGHITAISAVTGESGKVIGNSLKTIYSRITTMDGASAVLDSIGVSIKTIGTDGTEAVRPVNDILEDLSDVWWDLTDSQRQNIGVTLAGRYQLSR